MAEGDKTYTEAEFNAVQADLNKQTERSRKFEGEIATLTKTYEPYAKVDIEALKAAKEELQLIKEQNATNKGGDDLTQFKTEYETIVRGKYQGTIDELKEENATLKKDNREHNIVDKAMSEIGGLFNEDMHPFVKQYIRQAVDKDDNGNFIVKDDKGDLRYDPLNPAQPFSLGGWAAELTGQHPSMAKANVTSGSMKGGTKTNGRSYTIDPAKFSRMTRAEQMSIPAKERGELAQAALSGMKIGK